MARRRELKNIAFGLLNSFISRNNDVNGYWGIGKLYNLIEDTNTNKIVIDLISKTIHPNGEEFNKLINEYSHRLITQVERHQLKKEYLNKAKIVVTGYANEPRMDLGLVAPHRIHCSFELTDDTGKIHKVEKDVWCRRHDPKYEIQSVRQ